MNERDSERLRERFAAARNIAGDGTSCPAAERVWDSAAERLARRDNESVLRHIAACGMCAASWRIARQVLLENAPAEAPQPAPARRPAAWLQPRWAALAAAAAVVLAAGTILIQQQWKPSAPAQPVYRAEREEGALVTAIDPAAPLPRGELVLRWSGAPDGTTYDLRVTSESLQPLHRAFGIETSEYRVPESALDALPPGGTLLWTITAHLSDGRTMTSPAFRATVE